MGDLEITRRHTHAPDALRVASVREVVGHTLSRRRVIEHRAVLGPIVEVADRGIARLSQSLPHEHDPFAVGVGQGADQHGVHDAEHRGRQPDAERQSRDRHGRESRIVAQHANAVAQILPELIEPDRNPDGAGILPGARHAAELAQRRMPGIARRHPARDVLFGLALDVVANLAVEVRQGMLRHVRLSTRPIASASRSQLVVSIASCLRPFAVSR